MAKVASGAVRRGVTESIKDQPLRNRFLLRPRGMWRLRARIAEALVVQYKIESHVAAAVNQVERQVEVLSNGVVVFQDARPARTGAGVSYHGNGFDVAMQSDVQDVQRQARAAWARGVVWSRTLRILPSSEPVMPLRRAFQLPFRRLSACRKCPWGAVGRHTDVAQWHVSN